MTNETTLHPEDLEPGMTFPFGSRTLPEEEVLAFAREWDPLPLHADPEAAAEGPHGGIIASGIQTIAVYQRLIAEALWLRTKGIGGRTFEVRFRRPVRPGATLTGQATVEEVTHRPDRGNAIVVLRSELTDDSGEVVLEVRCDALLLSRPT